MTLESWVNNGCNMLSNYTSSWCCRILRINEKQLRQMELHDIYQIPRAGEVAQREIKRFGREHLRKVVSK